jgi:hypothetical protein
MVIIGSRALPGLPSAEELSALSAAELAEALAAVGDFTRFDSPDKATLPRSTDGSARARRGPGPRRAGRGSVVSYPRARAAARLLPAH